MCDYSLENVASRAAKVGDKLVSVAFPNSITRGFASPAEPGVAVCLLPGTELAFERDVVSEPAFGFFPLRKVGQRMARFCQVDLDQACVHHDALAFSNGKIVKVSRLCEGQRLTVLQLPVQPEAHVRSAEAEAMASTEAAPAAI